MSLVLIGGPIGVGKSSVIDTLLGIYTCYSRPQAYTSRAPRVDDNSNEFIHVSSEEMIRLKNEGELMTFDRVHDHFYGIAKDALASIENKEIVAIKEFHIRDHANLKASLSGVLSVLLSPSSTASYDAHIQNNADVKSRIGSRYKAEIRDYGDPLLVSEADIIIYNNFIETVDSIASRLHCELKKI